MESTSFNFGKTLTKKKQNPLQRDGLEFEIPDKQYDVDKVTVALLDVVIDSFEATPNTNLDDSARKDVSRKIDAELPAVISKLGVHLSNKDKQIVRDNVLSEIFDLGPLTALLEDENITEIMVNGFDQIFVENQGRIEEVPVKFRDNQHVFHTIDKIIRPIGRRVDESSPMVDARLKDGSRVNVIIPPLAINGPTITIRKFSEEPLTVQDLVTYGSMSPDMVTFLKAIVKGRMNVIISGGTGSGKTTLLNVLSSFIPDNERIVTIEDAAELQLQQKHVITLEARPANIEGKGQVGIRDLVINSLRMRPDRIIVGEVRSYETLDMLQAMNTGHDGSITTVHANTPRDSLSRLETMVHMSGIELPSVAIREQIASAIQVVIQVSRYPDGSRKVDRITEITGMESGIITMQDIFEYHRETYTEGGRVRGRHRATGMVPSFLEKLKDVGITIPNSVFHIK